MKPSFRLYIFFLQKRNKEKAINWNTLLIKEALHTKLKKPVLNSGRKASKELQLFN